MLTPGQCQLTNVFSSLYLCLQDEDDVLNRKRSNHVQRKISSRKPQAKVDPHVEEQFLTGRLLGKLGGCGAILY